MRATNYWQYDHFDVDAMYKLSATHGGTEPPEVQAAYITSASVKDPEHWLHRARRVTNVEKIDGVVPRHRHGGGFDADVFGWTIVKAKNTQD